MAKQSGGMPKIDEDFMKELISQGVPAKRENQPDDAPQPGGETETAHEGRQTETVRVEKPTNRKRKGGTDDYRETYFQKVELADRQPLYVSRTTLALAGCRFLHLHRFPLPSLMGGFRFAAGLRCVIRLALPLGGYALRDKFFHEILVYLRHTAALLCHIIVI